MGGIPRRHHAIDTMELVVIWSVDSCRGVAGAPAHARVLDAADTDTQRWAGCAWRADGRAVGDAVGLPQARRYRADQIGRASCRERV